MGNSETSPEEQIQRLQDQIIDYENLASIGLKISGILHEIRNPLNFVLNFSLISKELLHEIQDILDKCSLEEETSSEIKAVSGELENLLTKINENGKRAESLIQSILSQSRGNREIDLEKININNLIKQAFGLAYSAFRHENPNFSLSIVYDLDEEIEEVLTNSGDLQRVFINLFDNACYATNKKKNENPDSNYKPTLKVTSKNKGNKFEITVEDNGIGISPENLKKMFYPFFTSKPKGVGTGLGLTICKEIIGLLQGEIQVNSELDSYTKFVINLPKIINN